jgi:hypothetical protein
VGFDVCRGVVGVVGWKRVSEIAFRKGSLYLTNSLIIALS